MNEREQAAYNEGYGDCYRRANIALALQGLVSIATGVGIGWLIWGP